MKHLFVAFCFFLSSNQVQVFAELHVPSIGRIVRHENIPSRYVRARHADVWLPDGYTSPKKVCSTLYARWTNVV